MARKPKLTPLQKEYKSYIKAVRNLKGRISTQWKKHGVIIEVPLLTPKQLKKLEVAGVEKGTLVKHINSLRGEKLLNYTTATFNKETGTIEYVNDYESKIDYHYTVPEREETKLPSKKEKGDSSSEQSHDTYSDDDSLWYRTILANFKAEASHYVSGEAYAFIMHEISEIENEYGKSKLGEAIQQAFTNGKFTFREIFYRLEPAQDFIRMVRDFLVENFGLSEEKAREMGDMANDYDEPEES